MKVKVTTLALAALLLWAAAGVAQTQSQGSTAAPAAPAPNKIGVLNVRLAIVSTAEGKLASLELQSQFASRQTELANLGKQLQDLQNRLTAGGQTMADEERARLQRQGEATQKAYQRKQDELREDVDAAQQEVFDRIGRKLSAVVDRYTSENGYILILDTGSAVNFAPSAEITQDIIRLYDQANPVKAAQPAPRPQTQPGQTKPPAPKPPQQ